MDFEMFSLPAVALLSLTSLVVLASRDWRLTITALGVQYVGVFVLVGASWSLEMSTVKLVAGWMATAILGATQSGGLSGAIERGRPSGSLFRLLAGGLVTLIVFSVAPKAIDWAPEVGASQAHGGLLLIGMGLLMLGLTAQPLRVALGLLIVFSGFEIYSAAVERSVLVAGLLTLVNLSLALVGAYLHVVSQLKEPGVAE
ncbi:MAG: hypothetical protein ACE5GO_04850 [Anaerolineales bacterium]